MSTIEQTTYGAKRIRADVFARSVAFVSRCVRLWENRRVALGLRDMTDAQLADIGLRRGDLVVTHDLPFDVDPTERLGNLASARARAAL